MKYSYLLLIFKLSIKAQYNRFYKFIEKWESAVENSSECHLLGDQNLNFLEYKQSTILQNSQSYKLRKLIDLLCDVKTIINGASDHKIISTNSV